MNSVTIRHGQFHVGADCTVGENVVVDVDEEVRFGDRCAIPDNAYFGGRRVTVGDDFYGYSWEWRRLDVGRGRRGEEDAVLTVGSRCTFHDNRIDLARHVNVRDDVGLSPEVVIYTHYYWQSPLKGFPCRYATVTVGERSIVGFRSTLLPGTVVGRECVVAAGAVLNMQFPDRYLIGGVPARRVKPIGGRTLDEKVEWFRRMIDFRDGASGEYPVVRYRGCQFDLEQEVVVGEEDEYTDDYRWYLFRHGLRFYTKRPFKKLVK